MVRCRLTDAFDFPVGKPEATGYHKARGYSPNGHLGEDWNGNGGGDTDLNDPIYATARGVVVLSEDVKLGWGNCIIVRHAFRDATGRIDLVDSLYGHLEARLVKVGEVVERGQQIGKMGGNHGMYPVHLHFEMRKNLAIGMNRMKFARDSSNYYSPTAFIQAHRHLLADSRKYEIPVNTFAPHGNDLNAEQIAFANNRNMSAGSRDPGSSTVAGGTGESSGGVKKTGNGLSIPLGTGGKGAIPKVADKPKPGTDSRPAATPGTESKGDFWSRLKSKLNNGQSVDPTSKP